MTEFKLLIGGRLVSTSRTMRVLNPANESTVAECPCASEDDLNSAVAAAKAAFPSWAARSIAERRHMIMVLADVVEANAASLAELVQAETGKLMSASLGEVLGMVHCLRTLGGLDLPVRIIEDNAQRRVEAHRRPLGIVAAITPWNMPLLFLGFKVPTALLAGNTLVIKPAPTTPLATLRFAQLVADILPPGVLNVLTDQNDLGDLLTSHPDVRKVSFTGSVATGRRVAVSAAPTLKRLTLELGGNDPALVLEDADPRAVAASVFASAFQHAGQICFAIKRLYVHEAIYEEVCSELAALANAAVLGDGSRPGTTMGPVQNRAQFDKVKAYLANAHANGRVIAGGAAIDGPGYFVQPTIVRDIADGTRLVDEEQFGPILPVLRFADAQEAIISANRTEYGLGASIWSPDIARAQALARQIEAGTVWINKHLDLPGHITFGGAKQSGIGFEMGEEGLMEFTQLQIINSSDAPQMNH